MKLYTIQKDSAFQIQFYSDPDVAANDEPVSEHEITTQRPITFTDDKVVYEGSCAIPECTCNIVLFRLPYTVYNVDKSDIVITEVMSQ